MVSTSPATSDGEDPPLIYAFLKCYAHEDQLGQAIAPLRNAIAASQLELISFGHVLKRAPSLHLYLSERPSKRIPQLSYLMREFDHFIEAEDRSGDINMGVRNLASIVKRMTEDPIPRISWGDPNQFEIHFMDKGAYAVMTLELLL